MQREKCLHIDSSDFILINLIVLCDSFRHENKQIQRKYITFKEKRALLKYVNKIEDKLISQAILLKYTYLSSFKPAHKT